MLPTRSCTTLDQHQPSSCSQVARSLWVDSMQLDWLLASKFCLVRDQSSRGDRAFGISPRFGLLGRICQVLPAVAANSKVGILGSRSRPAETPGIHYPTSCAKEAHNMHVQGNNALELSLVYSHDALSSRPQDLLGCGRDATSVCLSTSSDPSPMHAQLDALPRLCTG